MIPLKVETLYNGGVVERLHDELTRVIQNICDPATPAKKTRKVKLEIAIKPNEQRNMAEVVVSTSSTLCPPKVNRISSPADAALCSSTLPASRPHWKTP